MPLKYETKITSSASELDSWLNSKKPVNVMGYAVCKDPFKIAFNQITATIAFYDETES